LATTADALVSYGKAINDPIEPSEADALAGLSISVALHADKPLKDLKALKAPAGSSPDPQAAAELSSLKADYQLTDRSGKALLEYRQLGDVAYLHGDIDGLAKLGNQDPSSLRDQLDQADSSLGPIKDALTGGWVELDSKTLQEFGKKMQESGGHPDGSDSAAPASAAPTLDPQTAKDLAHSIQSVFTGDFTFEPKGKENGADKIEVSAPFRKLAGDLLNAFKPVAAKMPGGAGAKFPDSLPTGVPDKNVTADLLIKDGTLTSVTFDMLQLDKKAPADSHLPLQLSFDQNAPAVQAPANADKLTERDLENAFGALMSAAAGLQDHGLPGGLGAGDDGQA
jgi:hypothetical protein